MRKSVQLPAGRHVHDVIPLYFKIYLVLQQRIQEGEWSDGVPLPSEQQLAQTFDVSRVTIRKTMNLLQEANLIVRQRGRGTFTKGTPPRRGTEPNFHGLVENIRNFEQNTQVKILKFHKVTTPERIPEEFGDDGKQDCLKIVKVRSTDRTSFSYSTCYVPYPEADIFSEGGLGNRSVLASLENAGIGVELVDQRLTAVLADADVARHLKIDVGLPLISMRGVMRDAVDRVVEVIEILYRPDCYVYRVTLSREGGKDSSPRWVQISG